MPTLPIARYFSFAKVLIVALFLAGVTACGGGGAKSADGGTGTPGNPGTTPKVATLSLSLTDPTTGQSKSSISSNSPALVTATVKKADGSAASGVVVTFSTDGALATLTPASGTALTDGNGIATVTLNASNNASSGAANLEAKAQIGTEQASGATAFAIGATNVTLSNPLTIGVGNASLSAFGTTSVSVQVLNGGILFTTPLSVSFSSGCAASGKAELTASVTTTNGVATASYRDKGCSGLDTITATLSGISATSSATITVLAPNTGAIQFLSANPVQITLKGTGGAGLKETSEVRFKVLDVGGNPVGGKKVDFTLSTTVGGVSLTSASAVSDPTTGEVVTNVIAGTVSTPVRVLATTTNSANAQLATQSDQLTITTGVPTQTAFSVSATTLNIEGWEVDGVNTTINARLADHFGNPPPGGTVVNFISEGAKVNGTCSTSASGPTTEGGTCSVLFTSQVLRPTNGRVSVLAYAVGEEGFTDLNGNGVVDQRSELVDSNAISTIGYGESFVDFNEDNSRDAAKEPFVDFDSNGSFLLPVAPTSALYKGILCLESSGLCDTSKTLHLRKTMVIVLSGSDPYISTDFPPATDIDLRSGQMTLGFRISDLHGNAMPSGTTVAFAGKNTDIVFASGALTVGNTTACLSKADHESLGFLLTSPIAQTDYCPTSAPSTFDYSATIKTPANASDPTGQLTLTIKTPSGHSVTYAFGTILF